MRVGAMQKKKNYLNMSLSSLHCIDPSQELRNKLQAMNAIGISKKFEECVQIILIVFSFAFFPQDFVNAMVLCHFVTKAWIDPEVERKVKIYTKISKFCYIELIRHTTMVDITFMLAMR
jgi:hypothetical protein